MKYAICQVSVSPIRAEASDRSEMVTQLLFGEKVLITETQGNWRKIKADFDDYEGWTDHKQLLEISEEDYNSASVGKYALENFNLAIENDHPFTLPLSSTLTNFDGESLKFGEKEWKYLGEFSNGKLSKEELVEMAMLYLNTPYLWGGKSVFGIDCSGLVQQVFKFGGVQMPRDSKDQSEVGENLSFVEEAEPGDLAFFDNSEGKIIHVGIILEDKKIIHAHGKVRIDPIDNTGIFNTDSKTYSHKLRILKRVL